MTSFLAVVKKELWSVIRDRTIIIAILIQLFIASFSSGLLLGMLRLYDPDMIIQSALFKFKIGQVGPAGNPLEGFMLARGLEVIPFASLTEAQTAFYANQVNAILVIPPEIRNTGEIKLYLPDSEAFSSIIRMVIQEPLKQYENYLRTQNGIEIRYTDLKGKPSTSFEFVYSILLPMLMFFPASIAGGMAIDSLTEEVENNTLQTLLSAPITVNRMLGAKIVAVVIISSLQCLAWLILIQLNGVVVQQSGWILMLAIIVSGITSTIAMLGALLLKDRERSQFIYSLILMAVVALSTLLDLSPIKTLSRLAIGDYYTSGWNVLFFAGILIGLFLLLLKTSRRLVA